MFNSEKENIGAAIKREREKLGMSQKEFANLAGFSAPYICDIEKGKAKLYKPESQGKIAKALGIEFNKLLESGSYIKEKKANYKTSRDNLENITAELKVFIPLSDLKIKGFYPDPDVRDGDILVLAKSCSIVLTAKRK